MISKNYEKVHSHIQELMEKIQVPAQGLFKYPSLRTCAGQFYSISLFVWDTHHMTLRYAMDNKPEQMKYFLLNMLQFQRTTGFLSCCANSANGASYTSGFHAQPFLAQNAAEYLACTNDKETIQIIFDKLDAYLKYWLNSAAAPFGLFRWPETWMSGFDNEITGTIFQPDTILPPDLPSLLYLECRSMAYLSRALGKDGSEYDKKADDIKNAINEYLWDEEMGIYSALNLTSMKPQTSWSDGNLTSNIGRYAYVSCPSFLTLFSGTATKERAERMIKKYILSPEHFRSRFGIRSLSKSSEYYNNARWGNPPRFGDHRRLTNSNWQGPVWIPLVWFVFHGLLRFGFRNEAESLANDTIDLISNVLDRIGSMSENFDAETGKELYADNFASWNLLADAMPWYFNEKTPLQLFPWENE